MTDEQKQKIFILRHQGQTYAQIAEVLELTASSVKTFCWRNKIQAQQNPLPEVKGQCRFCGNKLQMTVKAKPKKFCNDRCRQGWWNKNRDKMHWKDSHKKVCPNCGRQFKSYGNAKRIYCSHACYIDYRKQSGGIRYANNQ